MKKQILTIVIALLTLICLPGTAFAQSASGSDLTNQSSPGSAFQNASTGAQAQSGDNLNDSANASVLNQEPSTNLSVDSPAIAATSQTEPSASSAWVWYLVTALALIFVALWFFIMGMKKQNLELQLAALQDAPEPEVAAKPAEPSTKVTKPKAKKPAKHKKHAPKTKQRKKH
jgi:hypothetical protein